MKSIHRIDLHLTQTINKYIYKNRVISLILKYITHTSGGRTYILYFILIPFLPKVTGELVSSDLAIFIWVYGGTAFILFQLPAYFFIKNTFKRVRPATFDGVRSITSPPDKFSFPSGHSASATFLYLIVLQQGSVLSPYLAVWMAVILISRVGLGLHFVSDVLGGVALGVATFCITLQISGFDLGASHKAYEVLSNIIK